jgi:endonuclease/exonuclease/phosphatase family metal-dependent hydrolase
MTPLRVASFNIRHGMGTSGEVDTGATARACAGLAVDVLALQEVDRWKRRSGLAHQPCAIARATSMRRVFAVALRTWWLGGYGDALLVAGRLTEVEVLALPHERGHEGRTAILAEVDVRGTRLSVAATHLSPPRKESEPQLRVVLDALTRRPRPWLLLGDLNLPADRVRAPVEAAGLTLVDPTLPTFPAVAPTARIDHAAVAGLAVGAIEIRQLPVSDHRALLVELEPR